MPDSDVTRVGTDSGGRPLYMTGYMARWWEGVVRHLGWRPTIVQGPWRARDGGGVSASDGFHDYGGPLDIRTWDRTETQQQQMIRVFRLGGAAAWVRYPSQGFDEHIHLVLGTDPGIGYNAAQQFRNYVAGDAGLSGWQSDYHWRPDPIVTVPPASYMTEKDGFDMADMDDLRIVVGNHTAPLDAKLDLLIQRTEGLRVAHGEIIAALDALQLEVSDDATKVQVQRARDRVIAAITPA